MRGRPLPTFVRPHGLRAEGLPWPPHRDVAASDSPRLPDRNENVGREPPRLRRSAALLDGREGFGARRVAVALGVRAVHPADVVPGAGGGVASRSTLVAPYYTRSCRPSSRPTATAAHVRWCCSTSSSSLSSSRRGSAP